MTLYLIRSNGNLLAPEFSLDTKFSKKTARCRILFRLFVFYSTFRVWRSVPWNISSNKKCRRKKNKQNKRHTSKLKSFFFLSTPLKKTRIFYVRRRKTLEIFNYAARLMKENVSVRKERAKEKKKVQTNFYPRIFRLFCPYSHRFLAFILN